MYKELPLRDCLTAPQRTEQHSEWPSQRTTHTAPEPEPEPEPEPIGADVPSAEAGDGITAPESAEQMAEQMEEKPTVWKCWKPPKIILKKVFEAIKEHNMIQEGDRILIGVSGGKDSLTLVQVMYYLKKNWRWLGVQFDFGCVTVDPETEAFDPSPLKVYFEALGIPYFYESQNIIQAASSVTGGVSSICSFCARMKRGRLYSCIRREGARAHLFPAFIFVVSFSSFCTARFGQQYFTYGIWSTEYGLVWGVLYRV